MSRFYKPQNHLGHDLIPVGEKKPASITSTLDISWLDTISDIPKEGDANKIATGAAITAAIAKSHGVRFNATYETMEKLKEAFPTVTTDNLDTLQQTIFLIKNDSGADDKYQEVVCVNATDEAAESEDAVEWEKIGITQAAPPAASTEEAGIVKLATEISDDTETAVTPNLVKSYVDTSISDAVKVVKSANLTISGGKATISESGAVFLHAHVNSELFMPGVVQQDGTIALTFWEVDTTPAPAETATVYYLAPVASDNA